MRRGDRMIRRREVIGLLGGAASWPVAARAQQRLPMIGFLGPASATVMGAWTAAFVQRLRELGWTAGRNVAIEFRWADGRAERLPDLAAELVRLNPAVIATTGSGVPPLKQATSTIPIVLQSPATRSPPGWLRACRDPAATPPGYRSSRPISAASGW